MYYRSHYIDYLINNSYDLKDPIDPKIGVNFSFQDYKNIINPDLVDHLKEEEPEEVLTTEENILVELCERLNGRVITSENSSYEQSLSDFISDSFLTLSYFPFYVTIDTGYSHEQTMEEVFNGIGINLRLVKGALIIDAVSRVSNCAAIEFTYYKSLLTGYDIQDTLYWPCYTVSRVLIRDIYSNTFKRWSSIY